MFSFVLRIFMLFISSEGGFFKAHLIFPQEYPQKPPKMKFISEFWHPNGKTSNPFYVNVYITEFRQPLKNLTVYSENFKGNLGNLTEKLGKLTEKTLFMRNSRKTQGIS